VVYGQHVCLILPHANFYLWDNLKDRVYRTNPHTEEESKEKINFGSSSGRTSFGEFKSI
jgi:hypothetical protein